MSLLTFIERATTIQEAQRLVSEPGSQLGTFVVFSHPADF
jgi:hypothetical protein